MEVLPGLFQRARYNDSECCFTTMLICLEYSPENQYTLIIIRMISYFRQHPELVKRSFDPSLKVIRIFYDQISVSIADFNELFQNFPESLIACIGVSICQIATELGICKNVLKYNVRIQMPETSIVKFAELKAQMIGKYVTVTGTVIKSAQSKPKPTQISFQCHKCLQSCVLVIIDSIYRVPTKCTTHGCKSKKFQPDLSSSDTKVINCQNLKIQEINLTSDQGSTTNRIPRIIDLELSEDLVDSCVPGQAIIVSGILKSHEERGKIGNNQDYQSFLYVDVSSVQTSFVASHERVSTDDQMIIQQIIAEGNIVQRLVSSFCPKICGNQHVKLGLLLALFAGISVDADKNDIASPIASEFVIRKNIHILLVGDPGLGKSELLGFAAQVSPRSVYVCANTSTAVGLTAIVSEGGTVEAGALVLGDRGICCIDEFDKIVGDGWKSLLDVMEQQRVSIAKAGVICSLPSRTSVFAAANPVGGHYDTESSLCKNLKMDDALLSRFDLIFILLDKPNLEFDKMLSSHVLGRSSVLNNFPLPESDNEDTTHAKNPSLLKVKLESSSHGMEILDPHTLKKYITFAKSQIKPRMTAEASEVLKTYYLELRHKHDKDKENQLPITTRHLEAMIRLCESRSRMELRKWVSEQDAREIVELLEIMRSSQLLFGGNNDIRNQMISRNRKPSKIGNVKEFTNELVKISCKSNQVEFTVDQLKNLYSVLGIREISFESLIEYLNENSILLSKGSKQYKLLVT